MNNIKSLWPNLPAVPRKAPLIFIKEQASLLGQQTQNIIEAAVVLDDKTLYGLWFKFSLICHALGGYTVELFRFYISPTQLYPVELKSSFLSDDRDSYSATVNDEEELKKALAEIFSHKNTVSAIEAILAQTNIHEMNEAKSSSAPADGETPF